MTEVTLRIQGVPEAISAAVVGPSSFESALQAVTQVRQIGVPIARIEFLDEVAVKTVNQFSGSTGWNNQRYSWNSTVPSLGQRQRGAGGRDHARVRRQ